MKAFWIIITGFVIFSSCSTADHTKTLWELAKDNKETLTISTLFMAKSVGEYLSTGEGIDTAVEWCKKTGITHIYLETYRSRYTAEREVLENAKSRFKAEGFDVSGCVTTTQVGKISTNWNRISCYTDEGTLDELQKIFEYTASIFDEIMIDDFFFTDCECEECIKARGDKTWAQYRCDLMTDVSLERILKPTRAVNPDVKIIIKYPNWYDHFHDRGYDVVRETTEYDKIWVGTETRDYDFSVSESGLVQYGAYFIMRWLGGIGGSKTGGGWFDALGTTENTYAEQARQLILADVKEMFLFSYDGLNKETNEYTGRVGTGIANVNKLRTEIPGLFRLASLVQNKPIKGIHMPKVPDSEGYDERYVFSFVGMLGLPLVPAADIDTEAEAAFFSVHALKDHDFPAKLKKMLNANKPVLITDGLSKRLKDINTNDENLMVLEINGNPKSMLNLTREELKPLRNKLLAPFGIQFDAPNNVSLYLIGEDILVIENFNDKPVTATLEFANPVKIKEIPVVLPVDGTVDYSSSQTKLEFTEITPRTMAAIKYYLDN